MLSEKFDGGVRASRNLLLSILALHAIRPKQSASHPTNLWCYDDPPPPPFPSPSPLSPSLPSHFLSSTSHTKPHLTCLLSSPSHPPHPTTPPMGKAHNKAPHHHSPPHHTTESPREESPLNETFV
ncbi:unnamed protein product [Closterium sp. NIES-53]